MFLVKLLFFVYINYLCIGKLTDFADDTVLNYSAASDKIKGREYRWSTCPGAGFVEAKMRETIKIKNNGIAKLCMWRYLISLA